MKVCVFGAGAIGSNLAVRLMRAGHAEISVVARGAHLVAIRAHGLTLRADGREVTQRPAAATDDPASLPPQDCVIVTLKAHSLPAAAPAIARLLHPEGFAVFAVNGIPWWWRHGLAAGNGEGPLPLLDPHGALWSLVRPERAIGCVVDSSNELIEPGLVLNRRANNWTLGEPRATKGARLDAARACMAGEGVNVMVTDDIRREIWCKLAFNIGHSPVTALTGLGTNASNDDADLRQLKLTLMRELIAVATAHGHDIRDRVDLEQSTRPQSGVGAGSRPSMLQDVLAGRPIEAEALLGQPQALAREAGVATPALDIVCALIRGRDRALRDA